MNPLSRNWRAAALALAFFAVTTLHAQTAEQAGGAATSPSGAWAAYVGKFRSDAGLSPAQPLQIDLSVPTISEQFVEVMEQTSLTPAELESQLPEAQPAIIRKAVAAYAESVFKDIDGSPSDSRLRALRVFRTALSEAQGLELERRLQAGLAHQVKAATEDWQKAADAANEEPSAAKKQFWHEHGLQKSRSAFWTAQDMKLYGSPAIESSIQKLERIKALRKMKALPKLTAAEQQRVYRVILYRTLNPIKGEEGRRLGELGLIISDTQLNVTTKLTSDPILGRQGIFEHHGAYFNPDQEEVNSTMLLLGDMEESLATGGVSEKTIRRLEQRYERAFTDNAGDGLLSVWVARNVRRLARKPGLRDFLRLATRYEDFGLFGRKAEKLAGSDPAQAAAIEFMDAVLNRYDAILKAHRLDSDRFGQLPDADQRDISKQAMAAISSALDDPQFRKANAAEFRAAVERSKKIAAASELRLAPDSLMALEREFGSPQAAEQGVRASLGRIFIIDADPLKEEGVFAGWAGAPRAHDRALFITFKSLPETEGIPRTQMIFSVPNGETAQSLELFGEWLKQANLAKAENLNIPAAKAGSVFGREALQVAFPPGLLLSRQEILSELVRFEHYRAAIETALRQAHAAKGGRPGLPAEIFGKRTVPEGLALEKREVLSIVVAQFKQRAKKG